ncbi:MAG: choice-of-anchor B family protein [Myxococcota bacterium]|nr:choice-of-anchor B family protein [Myxococcota bacterium]
MRRRTGLPVLLLAGAALLGPEQAGALDVTGRVTAKVVDAFTCEAEATRPVSHLFVEFFSHPDGATYYGRAETAPDGTFSFDPADPDLSIQDPGFVPATIDPLDPPDTFHFVMDLVGPFAKVDQLVIGGGFNPVVLDVLRLACIASNGDPECHPRPAMVAGVNNTVVWNDNVTRSDGSSSLSERSAFTNIGVLVDQLVSVDPGLDAVLRTTARGTEPLPVHVDTPTLAIGEYVTNAVSDRYGLLFAGSSTERSIVVHEYGHYLVDAIYGFDRSGSNVLGQELSWEGDSDALSALTIGRSGIANGLLPGGGVGTCADFNRDAENDRQASAGVHRELLAGVYWDVHEAIQVIEGVDADAALGTALALWHLGRTSAPTPLGLPLDPDPFVQAEQHFEGSFLFDDDDGNPATESQNYRALCQGLRNHGFDAFADGRGCPDLHVIDVAPVEASTGQEITIRGGGFAVGHEVSIGGVTVPPADLDFVSDEEIRAIVPAGVRNEVDVVVSNGPDPAGDVAGLLVFESSGVDLLDRLPLEKLSLWSAGFIGNDVWGYEQGGREYALFGHMGGSVIAEVLPDDTLEIVFEVPLPTNAKPEAHRDLKILGDRAYIVGETPTTEGDRSLLQVVDLSGIDTAPRGDVLSLADAELDEYVLPWTPVGGTPPEGSGIHNLSIDPVSKLAYASLGGEISGGPFGTDELGFGVLDLSLDPPVDLGVFGDGVDTGGPWTGEPTLHVHDIEARTFSEGPHAGLELLFVSAAFEGVRIFEVTRPVPGGAPVFTERGTATYPRLFYTHQGETTEDGRYFLLNDELDEGILGPSDEPTRTIVINIEDLDAPYFAGEFGSGGESTDHNLAVVGDLVYEANYRSGLEIFDIHDLPDAALLGSFDTHPFDPGNSLIGAWGPFGDLPSGRVLVGDMRKGLFLLDAVSAVFGVRDVVPATGVPGASVEVVGAGFDPAATVLVGGVAAQVTWLASTRLSVVIPAGVIGPAEVRVQNPDGSEVALASAWGPDAPCDLNGDGQVDPADVLLVSRIVDGSLDPGPNTEANADVAPDANDGRIDAADVLRVARASRGGACNGP